MGSKAEIFNFKYKWTEKKIYKKGTENTHLRDMNKSETRYKKNLCIESMKS